VLSGSNATRGIRFAELHERCGEGIPALIGARTYPRHAGWEQRQEDKPWYTPTGRLEFYRPEREWQEAGESLPVWREPVDATRYEPNVIVSNRKHPSIRPKSPEEYGFPSDDLGVENRQARNVVRTVDELLDSRHPLSRSGGYRFVFQTPKYRWGAHSTAVDSDWIAMLFGPFGDPYRRDPRMPWTGEAYVEMNPGDADSLKVRDGDYVWIDADPEDRPYRGAKPSDPYFDVARVMMRVRIYPGMPPGTLRTWFNMYAATPATVAAQAARPGSPAKNPSTGYVSLFRHGSHQSGTRAWLRPTQMTDTMVRKAYFGQTIGVGFEADVHSPSGAPKEAFVRVRRAERAEPDGKGLWRPLELGLRPQQPSDAMSLFLTGGFLTP
jgi:nitrate reductase alpha subunit